MSFLVPSGRLLPVRFTLSRCRNVIRNTATDRDDTPQIGDFKERKGQSVRGLGFKGSRSLTHRFEPSGSVSWTGLELRLPLPSPSPSVLGPTETRFCYELSLH